MEGPAISLVSIAIRYESMSSHMKSSGGGGDEALCKNSESEGGGEGGLKYSERKWCNSVGDYFG